MRLWLVPLIALSLFAGGSPKPEDCVACHEKVQLEAFRKHSHGGLSCVKCHAAITELPHPEKLPAVECARCHRHESEDYTASVHGVARLKGNEHAPACTTCHGPAHDIVSRSSAASRVARKNLMKVCGACHDAPFLEKLAAKMPHRASRMGIKKGDR